MSCGALLPCFRSSRRRSSHSASRRGRNAVTCARSIISRTSPATPGCVRHLTRCRLRPCVRSSPRSLPHSTGRASSRNIITGSVTSSSPWTASSISLQPNFTATTVRRARTATARLPIITPDSLLSCSILTTGKSFPSTLNPSSTRTATGKTTASATPPAGSARPRRERYPDLAVLLVEDALYANTPHLRQITSYGWSYVLNVKPDSQPVLGQAVCRTPSKRASQRTTPDRRRPGATLLRLDERPLPVRQRDGFKSQLSAL